MDASFLHGPLLDSDPENGDFAAGSEGSVLDALTEESAIAFFEKRARRYRRLAKRYHEFQFQSYFFYLHREYHVIPECLESLMARCIAEQELSVQDVWKHLSVLLEQRRTDVEEDMKLHQGCNLRRFLKDPEIWCVQWASKATGLQIASFDELVEIVRNGARSEAVQFFFSEHSRFEYNVAPSINEATEERFRRRRKQVQEMVHTKLEKPESGICGEEWVEIQDLCEDLRSKIWPVENARIRRSSKSTSVRPHKEVMGIV